MNHSMRATRTLIKSWVSATGKSVMRAYETGRIGGVRIVIYAEAREPLYDTDDCYDMANAVNKAETWASEHMEIL